MNTPDPRAYVRLASLLRDQVTNEEIAPGDRMPPIRELRQKHGHTRQTIAKAMRVLEGEGLIYRVPGLGYFVAVPD